MMHRWIVLGIVAALLASCGGPPAGQAVTINGRDESGQLIEPVNVFATYKPRGAIVARVHDGDAVTMIRRDGDGVLIATSDGTQGWLTYWFINGLKKE